MKTDISTKEDIALVISLFYEKVKKDLILGPFFSEIMIISWEKHLQLMNSFWQNILFFNGEYEGNPIATHRRIHKQHPTTSTHFKKWLKLFDATVNENYRGPNATKMKKHSKAIAKIMMEKI